MKIKQAVKASRIAERNARVEAMRDGRKQRAQKFVDRKKEASRQACRG
jgi:hypothetical protein